MKLCGLVNGVVGWHSTWWLISMTKCGMHRYGTVYAFVVVFVEHILSCWTIARLISVMRMHALIHSANGEVESHQENKSSCYGLSRAGNAMDVASYWYSKSGHRFGVQSCLYGSIWISWPLMQLWMQLRQFWLMLSWVDAQCSFIIWLHHGNVTVFDVVC